METAPTTIMQEAPTETPAYTLTPVGIQFRGELTREEWCALGNKLGNAGRSLGFLIGDWLNYGSGKGEWGDTYTEAMRITGLEYMTLAQYARVSKKVQFCVRTQNLSFELHRKVAPLKSEEDQRKWLQVAEKQADKGKPMSSRRLAKSILLGRLAKDADMTVAEDDKGRDNVHPHVNRLMTFWRKMKAENWLQTTDSFMLNAMLEDLQPVVDMYNEVKTRLADFPHIETFEERMERFERMSKEEDASEPDEDRDTES